MSWLTQSCASPRSLLYVFKWRKEFKLEGCFCSIHGYKSFFSIADSSVLKEVSLFVVLKCIPYLDFAGRHTTHLSNTFMKLIEIVNRLILLCVNYT